MPIRIRMAPPSNSSYVNLVSTELMRAANLGNDAEVERLLAAGANVNARGNNGYTALMKTVRESYQGTPIDRRIVIRALIMAGANVNARGPNRRTVRNYAINGNRTNHGNRQEDINAALEYSATRSNRWYNRLHRRPAIGSNSNSNRPVLSVQAKANLRAKANTPVNRPWNNFKNKDPISLNNRSNWKGKRAIEVNTNGRKTYFYPANFNTYFTNEWKNMSPTSKSSIHPTKRHPLNRSVVRRNQVKLVTFIGNKPNKA